LLLNWLSQLIHDVHVSAVTGSTAGRRGKSFTNGTFFLGETISQSINPLPSTSHGNCGHFFFFRQNQRSILFHRGTFTDGIMANIY
jgi:hypothetical protein